MVAYRKEKIKMQPLKNNTPAKLILFHLAVSAGSVLIAAFLYFGLGEWLARHQAEADKLSYIGRYYNLHNRSESGFEAENIRLINFYETSPDDSLIRYNIAAVIERLGELNPLVIGLDIRFKGHQNPRIDQYLEDVILRNRNKIVVSRFYTEEQVMRSFFDTDDAHLTFGYTNVGDFYSHPSSVDNAFSERILSEAGLLNQEFKAKKRILDFSNLGVEYINYASFLEESAQAAARDIDGKIVILADIYDEKDVLNIPFMVRNQNWMPGAIYHIYCMNSMQKGGPFFKGNLWLSVLLCLLLSFLYSLFAGWLSSLTKKIRKDPTRSRAVIGILMAKPVILAIVWWMIPYLLMFVVTDWFRIVPNLTVAMLSVSMILLFFENLIDELKERMI